jgi:NitT/TauT family transport system substrate-binding protein
MAFRVSQRAFAIALSFIAALAFASKAQAEEIKIGVLKSTSTGPIYLAVEKHYFAAEGLEPTLVTFASAQPIAVAAAGSEIDVGVTAFTGGLFSLAGQGAIRIIAGYAQNVPGFKFDAFVVSNKAWQEGVRSYKDFAGRVYGVSQIGAPPHYELALLAEKYGFDFASVRISPLQSLANVASALTGGQVDASSLLGSAAIPLIDRGDVKLLGWAGDEVPYQLGSIFTGAKTDADHPDRLEKFLRVYRKAVREYHDAFTGPDGKRADGPGADEIAAIIAKYTGLSVEQVKTGVVYFDRDARVNEGDVMHQVEWFLKQGLIKQPVDPKVFFDSRFVVREDQK